MAARPPERVDPEQGFGGGFLRDCQGLAILKEHGIVSREEVRENLRERYRIALPEIEGLPPAPGIRMPADEDLIDPHEELRVLLAEHAAQGEMSDG